MFLFPIGVYLMDENFLTIPSIFKFHHKLIFLKKKKKSIKASHITISNKYCGFLPNTIFNDIGLSFLFFFLMIKY